MKILEGEGRGGAGGGGERGVFSLFAFSPKFHLCLPPFPQMHLLLRLADRSPLWVLLRDRELQLSLRASSPLARSLARSRETRFARPNRRAGSQANYNSGLKQK